MPVGLEAYSKEYEETGELSEESFTKLEEMGISRDVVDQYVAGIEASRNAIVNETLSGLDGGEETYSKITEWAANSLTEKELDVYNAQVASGDLTTVKMAVNSLNARYQKEVGVLPSGFQLGNGGEAGSNSFASVAEVQSAMSDARYDNDPAYRALVAKRLQNSNVF